jgi:hypothetical protein
VDASGGGQDVVVQVLQGSVWTTLGTKANDSAVHVRSISLGFDASGLPSVAYVDGQIMVRTWSGSAWSPVGPPAINTPPPIGNFAAIGVDDQHVLSVFAQMDDQAQSQLRFRLFRFAGGAWSTSDLDSTSRSQTGCMPQLLPWQDRTFAAWVACIGNPNGCSPRLSERTVADPSWTAIDSPTDIAGWSSWWSDGASTILVAYEQIALPSTTKVNVQVRQLNR